MIDTPARRREIIEILYFADDYVKIRPLAVRFGVSYATIRNDVDMEYQQFLEITEEQKLIPLISA